MESCSRPPPRTGFRTLIGFFTRVVHKKPVGSQFRRYRPGLVLEGSSGHRLGLGPSYTWVQHVSHSSSGGSHSHPLAGSCFSGPQSVSTASETASAFVAFAYTAGDPALNVWGERGPCPPKEEGASGLSVCLNYILWFGRR